MRAERLSREEEAKLVERWKKHADRAARDRIILAHHDLVLSWVRRVSRGNQFIQEDLVQEGFIALSHALDRFDPENGARFTTYSGWWVRARLQDVVRQERFLVKGPSSVETKRIRTWYTRVRSRIEQSAFRDGDFVDESVILRRTAEALDIPLERLEAEIGRNEFAAVSISEPEDDENAPSAPVLSEEGTTETALLDVERRDILSGLVKSGLSKLKDREADVIRRRYLAETRETLRSISADYGLSHERVRQIEVKALEKLLKAVRETSDLEVSDLLDAS